MNYHFCVQSNFHGGSHFGDGSTPMRRVNGMLCHAPNQCNRHFVSLIFSNNPMSPSPKQQQTPGERTSSMPPKHYIRMESNASTSSYSSTDWFSFLSAHEELVALFDIRCGDLSAAFAPKDNWGALLPRGQVLRLTEKDLQINYRAPLGSGAFCNVFTVYLKHPHTKEFTMGPLALKKLKRNVAEDETKAKFAIADLQQEARILRGLGHENVIDLYGVSNKNKVDKLSTFLVMDILKDTLESRLVTWGKRQKRVTPAGVVGLRLRDVAFGIAAGMEHLHSNRVLFRDLKPDNIGFSRTKDEVKIFDFGLAVKVAPGKKCHGRTGTILYMAPEVGSPEGYDFPADVYSFGILLWQMITTKIPFEAELSSCTGDASALLKEIRPPLKNIESKELQTLMESCWAAKPEDRPTFTQIRPKLRSIADSSSKLTEKNDESARSSRHHHFLNHHFMNKHWHVALPHILHSQDRTHLTSHISSDEVSRGSHPHGGPHGLYDEVHA